MNTGFVWAASSAQIQISATVTNIQTIETTSSGIALDSLGKVAYTDQEIGSIVLNSNSQDGFQLTGLLN